METWFRLVNYLEGVIASTVVVRELILVLLCTKWCCGVFTGFLHRSSGPNASIGGKANEPEQYDEDESWLKG